jgi:nucleoside-diphosphate-sugar epimerase
MNPMRVAVVGAAGYLGRVLLEALESRGHRTVAITRRSSALLKHEGREVLAASELRDTGPLNAVVNLAYPTSGSYVTYSRQNRELVQIVGMLAARRADVVHVSTLAVFGPELAGSEELGPVKRRFAAPYVESKIEMEMLLQRADFGKRLHVVRLGNIWGPGSPNWTAALAERLLFGEPVAIAGRDGYSNVTDVANAASYLIHLLEQRWAPGPVLFHHLAEHGSVRWSHWRDRMASLLGVAPVLLDPERGAAPIDRVARLSAGNVRSLRRLLLHVYHDPFAGAIVRRVLSRLPERWTWMLRRARPPGIFLGSGTNGFLDAMSCAHRFRSQTVSGWDPAVDLEASWRRVEAWVREVGYVS